VNKQALILMGVGTASLAVAAGAFFLGSASAGPAVPLPVAASEETPSAAETENALNEPIQPIRRVRLDERKVSLGRTLFKDTRLSGDNTISCNSCHSLADGGDDGRARSVGIKGAEGDINAPTVFNSSLNFKQFWDGRANSLEDQVDGPLHNPKEMGTTWAQVIEKLSADPGYVQSFKAIYADGLVDKNVRDAIATFERSLITPDSRFDLYLRGNPKALTDGEKRGYQLFKDLGCISCHQGMNAGGNMFQPFGVMANYFADRGDTTKADLGRFNVTGLPQDRHRFRVPGLRNVELTAPYFHDASAKTLEDAVRVMAQYQLAQPIDDEQVALVVSFLKTLTGKQPPHTTP
jgi:cytochrome c peroxidase